MQYPKRKHPRLKTYDYSLGGCYFVTVCTKDKQPLLSRVGQGLAPAESISTQLTSIGLIVEKELLALPERYPFVAVEKYVIMPTHLHAIIRFNHQEGVYADAAGQHEERAVLAAGASPRPTLMDVMRAFKSVSARICNTMDRVPGRKIWQASFYEKILRNEKAYMEAWQYIESNPLKWQEEVYYSHVAPRR